MKYVNYKCTGGGELYKLNLSKERRERLNNNSLSSLFDEVDYE